MLHHYDILKPIDLLYHLLSTIKDLSQALKLSNTGKHTYTVSLTVEKSTPLYGISERVFSFSTWSIIFVEFSLVHDLRAYT